MKILRRSSTKDVPDAIKPLAFHGVDLRKGPTGSSNWQGTCPFCGKRDHFFAHPEKGLWDCKVCGRSGNPVKFLGLLTSTARETTPRSAFEELSKLRGIPVEDLMDAGLGMNPDGEWLVPYISESGTVRDVGRYDGKKLMSTSGCKTQLWGADRLAAADEGARVWLCEGAWDGMAMRWMLRAAGRDDVVVATPGATIFKSTWVPLFSGKHVTTVYDSDDAGDRGQIKAHAALSSVADGIEHVHWPETSPDGWDLRDFAREAMRRLRGNGRAAVAELEKLREPSTRRDTTDGSSEQSSDENAGSKFDESKLPDADFDEVVRTFREHLSMSETMELCLKVMLAICLSNDVRDDPIWLYLMGPAGIGKTELLTSVQGSRRCVFRSKITPNCLVSGWRGEGAKDPSLIPKLKGKTFVLKDFTEILGLPEPAQREIYSTLRGAFDGYVDKSFGNGMDRHYKDCNFSMIAGVTPAILKHRESAMGERFLKFRLDIPDDADERERARMAMESYGKKKERDKALQAKVAAYLKRKLPEELPSCDQQFNQLYDVCKLVATMRVQVERSMRNDDVLYRPTREATTRLVKQLGGLARILAWMDGKDEVDAETMAIINRIALDTVCGIDMDIVDEIMRMGGAATASDIREAAGLPGTTVSRRLDDLILCKVVTAKRDGDRRSGAGGRPPVVFEVRPEIATLWRRAKGAERWNETKDSSRSQTSTGGTARRSHAASRRRLVRRASRD